MRDANSRQSLRAILDQLRVLFSFRVLALCWAPCLVITILHYRVGPEFMWVHDVLRRLYYLPILLAAFTIGSRGAVAVSVFASLVYFPHAFGSLVARDPGGALEKGLEIFLYNGIAIVAGLLVDRERREREKQEKLALKLSEALAEQRRVEAQLIRAGRLGALGELTAGIAHEIKNPLHAMKGTAEIVLDVIPEGLPERQMMDLHMREIDRLAKTADRFLSFARPSPPDRRPTDLREEIHRAVSLLSAQARREGVDVSELHWEGSVDPFVLGDPDQLIQLFLNIGINSIQAMGPSGGGQLSFAIRQLRENERRFLTVTISNDGPPIPESDLERIFDPFFTTKDDGTGLGLPICSRIADAHEGLLAARNIPGAGVEFILTLPAI